MPCLARLAAVCLVVVTCGSGCSSDSSDEGEPTSSPSSSTAASATPTAEPSATAAPSATSTATSTATSSPTSEPEGVDRLVVPEAAPTMPEAWHERFVIGYGPGKELLGTAPGGDSGTLDIGPEYGAPGPDGSWWFLDGAKARLAHYDASGEFLDQIRIPRTMLFQGRYFQWQLPHVMADGTLVASRNSQDGTMLLRVRDGVLDEIPIGLPYWAATYSDGTLLYGYSGRGRLEVVDPTDGSRQRTDAFRTPSGAPFSLKVGGRLKVELPDAGVSKVLPISTTSGAPAHVGVQAQAGADDTLHLFLVGAGEDDESVQLVGATSVSPSGAVAEVEPLANPFSEADPGSPAELVMAPGSSTPMLVYVLDDGVHVYERTG